MQKKARAIKILTTEASCSEWDVTNPVSPVTEGVPYTTKPTPAVTVSETDTATGSGARAGSQGKERGGKKGKWDLKKL